MTVLPMICDYMYIAGRKKAKQREFFLFLKKKGKNGLFIDVMCNSDAYTEMRNCNLSVTK